ncbi:hypothetical protein ANCDUO_13421 [Ancylostoma duodenale]|uniref:Uncharacterized protein n=1 Tax=Ancylostoma duodenale TaxID=51022 RepID=A0A0C2CJ12_9BILA|nr:hypothetical protein ANCDUO_13421 [Ancylostoma duodenale]
MSLLRAANLIKPSRCLLAARFASTSSTLVPGSSKIQLQKPVGEQGFFSYGRNFSRNPYITGVQKPQSGDTVKSYLLGRIGHAYEVYPLILLSVALVTGMVLTAYYSFTKIEIWIDKSKIRFVLQLQDELVAAAKKRGTR